MKQLSWQQFLFGLSFLFGAILWFGTVDVRFAEEPQLTCVRQGATACVEDFSIRQHFDWRTFSSNLFISGMVTAPTVVRFPVHIGRASRLVYSYHSHSIINPTLRVLSASQRKTLYEQVLLGTSPGWVTTQIEDPLGALPSNGESRVWIELTLQSTRGLGRIDLVPFRVVEGAITNNAWRYGWLFSFTWFLLAGSALYALVKRLRSRAGVSDSKPPPSWWRDASWQFRVGAVALASLTLVPLYIVALTFGYMAWQWVPLLGLSSRLPPALNLQYVADLLLPLAEKLWPDGWIVPPEPAGATERVAHNLQRLADMLPIYALGALTVATIGAFCIVMYCVSTSNRLRLPDLPSMTLLVLLLGCFAVYPAWHVPHSGQGQMWLSIAVVMILFTLYLFLQVLAWRSGTASLPGNQWKTNRRDLLVAGFVILSFLVVHYDTIHLPLTYKTDERSYGNLVVNAYRLIDPMLYASLWQRFLWWAGTISGLGLLTVALRTGTNRPWGWILLGLAALLVVGLNLFRSEPVGIEQQRFLFSYPPLYNIVVTALLWLPGHSWESARLASLIAAATGGGLMYLLGVEYGFRRLAALCGTIAYLASQIVYYWSTFSYNSFYMSFFLIAGLLFLGRWVYSANARNLYWLAVCVVAAYLCRMTGAVLWLSTMLSIPVIMSLSERHRARSNLYAFIFYVASIVIVMLLWQKLLAGAWYLRHPTTLHLTDLPRLLRQETWQLVPWSFLNANGLLLWGAAFAGSVCGWIVGRFRYYTIILTALVVADTVVQIVLDPVPRFYGYTRLIIPIMPAVGVLVMVLVDCLGRLHPRGGAIALVVITIGVLLSTDYRFLPQSCVMPGDLNEYVQYHGKPHGFVPEEEIVRSLPADVAPTSVYLIQISRIRLREMKQFRETDIRDEKTIFAAAKSQGARFVAFMHTDDLACRERDWNRARNAQMIDERLVEDPMRLTRSPFFEYSHSVAFPPFEVMLFRVAEAP